MPVYYQANKRRTIDGKLFLAYSFASRKVEARAEAEKLRRNGYSARVLKTGKVWSVYYRR